MPAETDADLLRELLEVLRDLQASYDARFGQPEARPPDDIRREFMGVVRAAPPYLLLPRLVREQRLSTAGAICVCSVLLRCCGIKNDVCLNSVILLACGLSPVAAAKVRWLIQNGRGVGRLVRYNRNDGQLYPTQELLRLFVQPAREKPEVTKPHPEKPPATPPPVPPAPSKSAKKRKRSSAWLRGPVRVFLIGGPLDGLDVQIPAYQPIIYFTSGSLDAIYASQLRPDGLAYKFDFKGYRRMESRGTDPSSRPESSG